MSWLSLAGIGALVGVDATSFPQAMFSRPIIAGTLGGLAFGRPAEGFVVGAVLEIFALVILPFGAARYPESGTAAAAAAAAYAQTATPGLDHHALLLAVAFALAWEQIAGLSVVTMRRINETLVGNFAELPNAAELVPQRQLLAIGLDSLRGMAIVLLGALLGAVILETFRPFVSFTQETSARILIIGCMAMLGATLPLFGGIKQRRFAYAAGLICGLGLLFL